MSLGRCLTNFGGRYVGQNSSTNQDCSTHTYPTQSCELQTGISGKLIHSCVEAGITHEIDITAVRRGHVPVCVKMWIPPQNGGDFIKRRRNIYKPMEECTQRELNALDASLASIQSIPFGVGATTHYELLCQTLRACVQDNCPIKQRPKRNYINDETWELICEKR